MAVVAPAALSPLAGAALVGGIGLPAVFAASAIAAGLQFLAVRRLRSDEAAMSHGLGTDLDQLFAQRGSPL